MENEAPVSMPPSAFEAQAMRGQGDVEGLNLDNLADPSRSSSGSGFVSQQHPNVFVRGLPLAWSEAEISAVFQQYGELTSLRLVRHSVTKQSLGYGFVRYQESAEAQAAISALDGTSVLGHTLQVKFADADAGPPSSGAPSGLTPSDSCYVKHLPATYGLAEVQALFEVHGAVLDVKLFPCLDQFRGGSALVRMASLEASDRAISSLNNSTLPGAVQSLIVRFAESPAEKAARLTRRERQQLLQRSGLQTALSSGLSGLDAHQLQQALQALAMGGLGGGQLQGMGSVARAASIPAPLPSAPMVSQQYNPGVSSSVCVKGMPTNADRLWIYETFARFGAVAGMRILIDEQTGLCNGTAFINYADAAGADRARAAMNGMRAADRILHVVVQQAQQAQRAPSLPHYGGQPNGHMHGNGSVSMGREASLSGVLAQGNAGGWQSSLLPGGTMAW